MGFQKGLVHLSGQFGDVQLGIGADGRGIAKFVQPVKRKKVKKGSNYALTRKNNDEFSGSSAAAHSLRRCMGERIKKFAERKLRTRMMERTYAALENGPGMGGERTFEVGANAGLLKHLAADKEAPLNSRFQAPFTITVNPDRNTATLDVPAFGTDYQIDRPQGATHFRLLLVAGVLSDFHFVGGSRPYEPVNAGINELTVTMSTLALPAYDVVNNGIQLIAAIPGLPVLPSTACLVVSVGIEFLRVINNYEQVMESGRCLQIVEVV